MTSTALDALKKIRALRKSGLPQALLAERKLLSNLNLSDVASVVLVLETDSQEPHDTQAGSVSRG